MAFKEDPDSNFYHAQDALDLLGKYNYHRPISAKSPKDIPERLNRHNWLIPGLVDFNKLTKYYLKVRMCCAKCKEKVEEEIWEVPGVFDVTVENFYENKVVVTVMPWSVTTTNLDLEDDVLRKELLRKARKIDCRAQFLPAAAATSDNFSTQAAQATNAPSLYTNPATAKLLGGSILLQTTLALQSVRLPASPSV